MSACPGIIRVHVCDEEQFRRCLCRLRREGATSPASPSSALNRPSLVIDALPATPR